MTTQPYRPYDVATAIALSSVGVLFAVLSLIDRAADELSLERSDHYPLATERYAAFRTDMITHFGVEGERYFRTKVGEFLPPDRLFESIDFLVGRIRWSTKGTPRLLGALANDASNTINGIEAAYGAAREVGLSPEEALEIATMWMKASCPNMEEEVVQTFVQDVAQYEERRFQQKK